jgi:WD40 repeat protein
VSPDGNLIATAGNDGAVRIWRSDAAENLHLELSGHDCHVYHVAFHPDGKSLVSADLKGRVKHWDVETGKQIRELDASRLHTYSEKYEVDVGGIRGMTFNADGSQLACAGATGEDKGIAHSGDARVLLFDWESGELLKELRPEKKEVCTAWGVQFHPDGFIVASGGSRTGGFLWFWTSDDEVAFHQLKFHQRAPGFDVDLSPDNRQLAVADHDGTVRLYQMAAEKEAAQSATTT